MSIDTNAARRPGEGRAIRRDTLARCPFTEAVACAESFLQRAAERGRLAELVVSTDLSVLVVEDYTDSVRRHDALEFRWRPHWRALPAARALLTVRPHAPQGTQLQFSIFYVPPLGLAGRLFDVLVGRQIAWFTAGRLLRRLRIEIERATPA
jgi:hypothetical protein